jgi:hypothetical protein
MPTLALFLFRFARLLFSGHAARAAENAALRLQLAAFQRQLRRPVLPSLDRLHGDDFQPAALFELVADIAVSVSRMVGMNEPLARLLLPATLRSLGELLALVLGYQGLPNDSSPSGESS